MDRQFYVNLAHTGLRMPIGADLVLHEKPNPAEIVRDGKALGQVVEETARRYRTPLAFAHMDLQLEKTVLLEILGVPPADIPLYHFPQDPGPDAVARTAAGLERPLNPALRAHIDSVGYIAQETDLVPVGMTIGPFSLMTKLLKDPITPIYLAGSGVTAEEDPDVALVARARQLSLAVILFSVEAQIRAGAKAVFMAEPAANVVYLSPKQIEAGSDVFERYPIAADRRVKAFLANAEAPDPVPGTDHRARLEVRRSWARLIRQVYEVDPLLCPRCGGTMKVIAVIEPACADTADRRPAVIQQIRSAELATKPRAPGALHRSAQLSRATRPAP